ncbi:hypothetical protein AGRA3207_004571 [Actinomadura graeca]|uniref:Uncharacterized protein n=1 Tax=Actinomadura graeca TaxID=2750812 RepID=A0ABX8R341_9ACTN|nr:hypothetical protein [Actinomadura graeca]QXJ23423.1 hypothetical protein AGRA3207_004571 [Actinomadura graeca]
MTAAIKLINRFIFTVDVRRYTTRDARRQIDIQAAVGLLSDQAAVQAGLDPGLWFKQTTGDGFIAVTEGDVDSVRLVGRYPDELNRALTLYNLDRVAEARIDLRLAIHHGTIVRQDGKDDTGEAFNEVSRLLNATSLRTALERAAPAHLAAIVSEPVHSSIVRSTFDGLSAASFAEVQAEVADKDYRRTAYLYVPGLSGVALGALLGGGDGPGPGAAGRPSAAPSGPSAPSAPSGPSSDASGPSVDMPGPRVRNSTRIKGNGNRVVNAGGDATGSA